VTQGKKGWNQSLMISSLTKEASYDAGIVHGALTSQGLTGYEFTPDWAYKVVHDKDEVTGKEHGYTQEIVSYGHKFNLKFPKCKPNDLAIFSALCLGTYAATQDPGKTAYRHKCTPVAEGSELPSVALVHLIGGIQTEYTGVKGNTLKLSGEEGGLLSLECELIGSGTSATNADSFIAAVSESWLKMDTCTVWLESGANIQIAATATQGTEDISSATPDAIKARMKNFEFTWNNNLQEEPGFGGAGVLQGLSYGRRGASLKMTMRFDSTTEIAYFTAQDAMAVEFDFKGASLIASGGTMYFGGQLVIPRCKVKAYPKPEGGANDTLTQTLDFEVFEDGTNSAVILTAYTATAAYLA